MDIPAVERIVRQIEVKQARSVSFGEIDKRLPFTPEELTQLYYSGLYDTLTDEQKLRYNQLFAMRAIEQLMTLEARFIKLVIRRSQRNRLLKRNAELRRCMDEMILEEEQHYRMFLTINRRAEPSIYQDSEMFFARMTLAERLTLETLARVPGITSFLLWILLILEEFSTHISRQMLQRQTTALGQVEENFVKAHREHLKDEGRHVLICANALVDLISNSSTLMRRLNARLLDAFMRDYMTPKRGGLRVIDHLCEEYPSLRDKREDLLNAIRKLSPDPLIWGAIESPSAMPVTNELMDRFPEFRIRREEA